MELPTAIQLKFRRPANNPDESPSGIRIDVIGEEDHRYIMSFDALRETYHWLRDKGYDYIPGTNAIWSRKVRRLLLPLRVVSA
jgi:hypothetical protein